MKAIKVNVLCCSSSVNPMVAMAHRREPHYKMKAIAPEVKNKLVDGNKKIWKKSVQKLSITR
jgi:hypothetical protein